MSLTLTHLNDEQRKAVEATEGRLLILAGAGSGKTLVLTTRIAYLLSQGVSPSSILGLTFTNKAASEMRERVAKLTSPSSAKLLTLSTFHSFCMRILRKHIHLLGYTQKFSLYDEKDLERIIDNIIHEKLDQPSKLPSTHKTKKIIMQARGKGLDSEEISDTSSPWHQQFAREVFKQLRQSLRAYNALDFDDLLFLTVELFERHPEVLAQYQKQYRYIMIDEYQDTNPIQYKIASLLSQRYQNLCVVGDDDQSIYGWRGACVDHILTFESDHVIKLEQNYRSTNTILQAANAVIANNKQRHGKTLWSQKSSADKIEIFHAPNELKEVEAVLYRLVHLKEQKGLRWKDIAILYRSNHLSRAFETALMRFPWKNHGRIIRGIPYKVFGGTEFYLRKEVQDLFAYLKVIENPQDQASLLRIINYPRRGIGDKLLSYLTETNRAENCSLWSVITRTIQSPPEGIGPKAIESLREFYTLLQEGKNLFASFPLRDACQKFMEALDLESALEKESNNSRVFEMKKENVGEVLSSLEEYSMENPEGDLAEFLTQTLLQDNYMNKKRSQQQDDCLQMMTFHSSKGLEFPACFLVGLEDHIIPHERSLKETGIDEERRLMYVAITRAKQWLTISMAQTRKRMGKNYASKPSRFLFEIDNKHLNVTRWDDV